MNLRFTALLNFCLFLLLVAACDQFGPSAPEENELLDGPVQGLSGEEQAQFLAGDIAFNDEIFTVDKGLGPVFVGSSCGSCHAGDGKGHPFIRFTRFGQGDTTGNSYLDVGGPQLQHKAIPGFQPEKLPSGAPHADLLAPAVTGLGFLEAVPEEDLLAMADPYDLDNDGISGRLHWNYLPEFIIPRPQSLSRNGKYLTRIGKKGAVYNLLQQTVGAYNQDMGITSVFDPIDPYSGLEQDPEVDTKTIRDVVFYLKTLKAPISRNQNDPDVAKGEQIFSRIQCGECHKPTLRTGHSEIAALSNMEIHPYTDLLLHDMGPDLDDGYTEGFALTSEWRTPPLWGLGLSKNAQGGDYFLLHDGRATSIEEAILFHGGEAANSKNQYRDLPLLEKQQLIAFLESL